MGFFYFYGTQNKKKHLLMQVLFNGGANQI